MDSAEVEERSQHLLHVLHHALVHLLGPLQLLQSLHQRVVTEDGPGQPESVGRTGAHPLHKTVFHLLQDNVERFALLRVRVQLVVADRDVTLT